MRTIVAVIVYNRFSNLQEWVRCWKMCQTEGAQLVVINNQPSNSRIYEQFCQKNGIHYVGRTNIGFDIGAYAALHAVKSVYDRI